MRQKIPTTLTLVDARWLSIKYLEVMNDTAGAISFGAYDMDGLAIVPMQVIGAGNVMTYRCDVGAPVNGGLWWVASAVGLVGWYKMV